MKMERACFSETSASTYKSTGAKTQNNYYAFYVSVQLLYALARAHTHTNTHALIRYWSVTKTLLSFWHRKMNFFCVSMATFNSYG
jgi:hypothetical protein